MRRIVAALVSTLLTLLALPAHPAADPAAESPKVFARFADGKPQPGCAASVMRDGKVLWADGFGYADLATGRKVTADTVFNIASMSKQFTAFAILQLEAEGKLALDDSIRKFVPELGDFAQPVTLRHLLHHTGGLRDYMAFALYQGVAFADKLSEEDVLKLVARQKGANFAPGSEHQYSNTGYFLLSIVVERVSKQSMREYSAEHIFAPLGMRETGIVDRYPHHLSALARGYGKSEKSGYDIDESAWENTGDGQVHTTVRDFALWDQNLSTGRVGGRALIEKMTEAGTLGNGDKLDYAMALMLGRYRGLPMVHHSGSWAGYHGNYARFPQQNLGIVVLCNSPDVRPRQYSMKLADVWLGDTMKPLDPAADSPAGASFLREAGVAATQATPATPGLYANEVGSLLEVRRGKQGLELSADTFKGRLGAMQANVYPLSQEYPMIWVAFPARDRIAIEAIPHALMSPHVYSPQQAWQPKSLQPFVGSYFSDDADVAFSVAQGKSGLVLTLRGETVPLRPVATNRFRAESKNYPLGLIEFRADGSALLLADDPRGLVFRRKD
jgi:CubicO group peptidase (beta-lactamase class C family)